jgi:hypothetical protein
MEGGAAAEVFSTLAVDEVQASAGPPSGPVALPLASRRSSAGLRYC